MLSLKNNKLSKSFLVLFSLIIIYQLIGIYNVDALNYYETSFYKNSTGNPATTINPPIFVSQDCDIQLETKAKLNASGSYSATIEYFNPYLDMFATGSRTFSYNQSCVSMGIVNNDEKLNGFYETKSELSHTASFSDNFLETKLKCNVSDSYINFTSLYGVTDSLGYIPNMYYLKLIRSPFYSVSEMAQKFYANNFSNCNYEVLASPYNSDSIVTATSYTVAFYYPFNSGNGEFNYDLIGSHIIFGRYATAVKEWYYYKQSDYSSQTYLGTADIQGSVTLDENEDYVLMFYMAVLTTGNDALQTPNSTYAINIYQGNYQCSLWSDCISGQQSRNCEDLDGVLPNKIEYQSCYSLPDATLNLGFEDSFSTNVFYSYPTWWIVSCLFYTGIKEVEYPDGWSFNYIWHPFMEDDNTGNSAYVYDTIEMTKEESFTGVKSLKMWTIPPEQYIPQCESGFEINGSNCSITPYGNLTVSRIPFIEKNISETYAISKNFTFEYPNITISLYLKKCINPVQEWAGNSSLFGLCGNGYYTNDKTNDWSISNSRLYFSWENLNESNLLNSTQAVYFNVDRNDWAKKELRLENLSVNDTYKISLGLMPISPFDTEPRCIYIDEITVNGYTGIIPCESYCDGLTRYEARIVGDYGCVYDIYEVSPLCVIQSIKSKILNCQDFCDCDSESNTYLTYFNGNNETGECLYTLNEDSSFCSDFCSKEGATNELEKGAKEFLDTVNLGFLSNFFSVLFLISGIMVVIAGALAYYIGKSWQVFVSSLAVEMFIASFIWVETFGFIGIVMAILLALFLAKFHSSGGSTG